ncbi:unnamed protein product, partial [Symbiodinium microadriaticum]
MGWAADIADYGYEHGITDFMEAWHKYMDPGPDWDPDNPEWQARQRQQQRQEQAERDARDRSRSRERRRAQAPDKIAAVVRTCIAKGQTRKDLFAACEIVGVDDPLAVAESGEEIVQRIYERLDDEVLNATQWVLLEASKSVEKAVFVGIVEPPDRAVDTLSGAIRMARIRGGCNFSEAEQRHAIAQRALEELNNQWTCHQLNNNLCSGRSLSLYAAMDTGEVSGAAFRPRFWGTSLAQEAPFLADAPAGSPTNLSVFEASGLIGDRGAVYLTRPYLSAVEPFYEVQAKLANESLRSDAPINSVGAIHGPSMVPSVRPREQVDKALVMMRTQRAKFGFGRLVNLLRCYEIETLFDLHLDSTVLRLAANRSVLVAYTTDERPVPWPQALVLWHGGEDAKAALRLRVLSLPSLLMGDVVESNGGASSGYIDLDEPNHCVWTVGPETIKCFEIDTLEECFRLLQRDQAPLLRHTLGLFALVWASSEHLAMVVYSAGGMKHFDSEVQMQNLVTVVEILTMDVFLCQSQGEDAQLLDVSKGQQLCTLPSTEHWQLPNIAVLTHLGVILETR